MSAAVRRRDSLHRPFGSGLARCLLVLAVLVTVLAAAQPAAAHTDFDASTPEDGETVDTPVDEIVIAFTSAAAADDDSFVVLDPQGVERAPDAVTVEEDRVFRLAFDPPLAGGTVGVRWSVRSGDSHVVSGSFSFLVSAPVPTTSTTTTTVGPTTTVSADQPATDPVDESTNDVTATAVAPDVDDPDGSPAPITSDAAVGSPADDAANVPPPPDATTESDASTASPALEEFLATEEPQDGEGIARLGRTIGFASVVFGLGVLAFAGAVLVGSRREVGSTLRVVRVLGIVIAVGALTEYAGVTQLLDDSLSSAWSTSAGFATVLRLVGGILLVVGVRSTIVDRRRPAALSADVAVIAADDVVHDDSVGSPPDDARWRPDARSWPAFAGVAAILGSFWFDGHTVTEGIRPLHAVVNTVHVGAGAVWVGGVAALATVAWSRRRSGRPARYGELIVRFSSIATVALVAVAGAGAAMTVMIMDSFGDLTSTDWGRLMLLKLGAVAVAAALGAYNHVRLRPAFDAAPNDPRLLTRARTTLTVEAIVLGIVVVVTASLVVAAT